MAGELVAVQLAEEEARFLPTQGSPCATKVSSQDGGGFFQSEQSKRERAK